MRPLVSITALAATAVVLVIPTGSSDTPDQRRCPPWFRPYTEAEQYAVADQMGVPFTEVATALDMFDKNGDRILCMMFLPSGAANLVDNRTAR